MKILTIGNFLNPSWDGSLPDEEHIASALEELGHEVTRCQRETVLEQDLTEPQFDFILLSQWDGYRSDVMFEFFKRLQDCPIVYWAFDYQADGQEWHELLVNQADLYLSKRIADSKYDNWQWLAQDFAPQFLDKYSPGVSVDDHLQPPRHKDIDVLFTGSFLPWAVERNETLEAVNEKFNLVIHSVNQWPYVFKDVRPPIMDDGLPELYARAKVILSIDHTIEAGYWSDRLSQILCCGGFALHRYVPLCENTFHDNVGYFYNTVDCLDKVQYYLDNYDARESISRKGYEYAQKNLKVINRVKDMLIITESIL